MSRAEMKGRHDTRGGNEHELTEASISKVLPAAVLLLTSLFEGFREEGSLYCSLRLLTLPLPWTVVMP